MSWGTQCKLFSLWPDRIQVCFQSMAIPKMFPVRSCEMVMVGEAKTKWSNSSVIHGVHVGNLQPLIATFSEMRVDSICCSYLWTPSMKWPPHLTCRMIEQNQQQQKKESLSYNLFCSFSSWCFTCGEDCIRISTEYTCACAYAHVYACVYWCIDHSVGDQEDTLDRCTAGCYLITTRSKILPLRIPLSNTWPA